MQRSPQIVSLSGLLLLMSTLSTAALAQGGHPATQPNAAGDEVSMVEQLTELRAKVARLEASLGQNHQGMAGHGNTASNHPGMAGGMGMDMGAGMGMQQNRMDGMAEMGDKTMPGMGGAGGVSPMKPGPSNAMGMGGMKMEMGKGDTGGMKMMGKMKGTAGPQGMAMNSSLPGFPGASHIYHIGASGFFLDHSEHLELTPNQQSALGRIKEKSVLAQNTADRNIQEAEQQLWTLTAADQPDAALIEKKIREIEKLRGDQRFDFIRAVGEAAKVLTADQRQALLGQEPKPSN